MKRTPSRALFVVIAVVALALGACAPPPPVKIVGPPYHFPKTYFQLGPDDFVEITAGDNHTCARKKGGNVYCWGLTDLGQVGISANKICGGTTPNCVDRPTLVMMQPVPIQAWRIDAGKNHTCVLTGAGGQFHVIPSAAACWGDSSSGQIGADIYGDTSMAGPLQVFVRQGGVKVVPVFSSISAGGFSTCGRTSSDMFCWGQIANRTAGQPTPLNVFTASGYFVSVGGLHACTINLIVASPSQVQCWGNNVFGQVGLDPVSMMFQAPPPVTAGFGTLTTGGMATGDAFTCVDQQSGIVQCIGQNDKGQLGNGQTSLNATFTPQSVVGGVQLNGVAAGSKHACALDSSGTAYSPSGAAFCWGEGNRGQLGSGNQPPPSNQPPPLSSTPVKVTGGLTFRAVAAGGQHSCAIGTDNHIYCWGDNTFGQLGDQSQSYPGLAQVKFDPNPRKALDPP